MALLANPAHAFPIPSQEYESTTPFAAGIEGIGKATFLSGRLQAASAPAHGPFVAFNTTDFAISGLTRVCWTAAVLPTCLDDGTGGLRLGVSQGGAIGLQFPRDARSQLSSRHTLAVFLDVGETLGFEGYQVKLGRSLAAVHVGGQMSLTNLPDMPATPIQDMATKNAAGLVLLDARTKLTVFERGQATQTLSGNEFAMTFQGQPRIAPFGTSATLTPFASGSNATLGRADAADAAQGVDLRRVDAMVRDLGAAFDQPPGDSLADQVNADMQPLLGPLLDGALLSLPTNTSSPAAAFQDITLLRFDSLAATSSSDGTVALSGSGPLQIQEGRVVGAPSLLGLMPWWCWVLWVGAIGLWIARLVVKPAKENEKWDRLNWVGWVAGAVVSLVVFWLWDEQVQKVLGVSLLSGASGYALYAALFLQVVIGLVIYLVTVVPMSSLLKSGARFAGQGRFMGLHRPVAMALGFVLGASLLLSYIDFLMGFAR